MLTSGNFWMGVIVGIGLYIAYKRFGGMSKLGGGKQQ